MTRSPWFPPSGLEWRKKSLEVPRMFDDLEGMTENPPPAHIRHSRQSLTNCCGAVEWESNRAGEDEKREREGSSLTQPFPLIYWTFSRYFDNRTIQDNYYKSWSSPHP